MILLLKPYRQAIIDAIKLKHMNYKGTGQQPNSQKLRDKRTSFAPFASGKTGIEWLNGANGNNRQQSWTTTRNSVFGVNGL
uniref:Uncharacterized protein n=1 Tax=Acrobeloides nanus TaxID=290746 RepID=A0A914D957_9BILA